jgi:prepilin peptidase CpaA
MIQKMTQSALIGLAPLILLLIVAAVIDARERRIPNWLTFGLLLAGLVRAIVWGHGGSLEHALLGMLVGGSIPLALFAISALGAGDVKLLAAVGAWIGPGPVLAVFCVEAVLGMAIVLVQAAIQGRLFALFRNSAIIAASFACVSELGLDHAVQTGKSCRSVNRPLPYAVPLLAAVVVVLWMNYFVGR